MKDALKKFAARESERLACLEQLLGRVRQVTQESIRDQGKMLRKLEERLAQRKQKP